MKDTIKTKFNKAFATGRIVVLDIETTGLFVHEGHRIVDVAVVEMVNGDITGLEFQSMVNPERPIPAEVTEIHGITDDMASGAPKFADIADELRRFIGDAPIIITCRTGDDGYTLDVAFINDEFKRAGVDAVNPTQWCNVRRWSEKMFGKDQARLDAILDRYGISRAERDENGHSALLDAQLLAEVFPKLVDDYKKHMGGVLRPKKQQPKKP